MGLAEMLVYSLVGLVIGAVITLLVGHYRKIEMSTGRLVGVLILWILGLLAVAFALDWAYACTLETEGQSAAMGLLIFGGVGVILAVIGLRLGMVKKAKVEDAEPAEVAEESAE